MKILPLLFIFPLSIPAQTEFFLSTAGHPIFNSCTLKKDSLPVHCSIISTIRIFSVVWNPDSVAWCTREGYYRSRDIAHQPLWKFDGTDELSLQVYDNGFSAFVPILDTLEHTVTAAYLDFPVASFRYKAGKRLPIVLFSGNRKLFTSDSVHMCIESTSPATWIDSTPIPIIREDSIRNDTAILTFDCPSDTSAKLTLFLCNRQSIYAVGDFAATYSPALNSYSIMIPLVDIIYLAKRHGSHFDLEDTINDTIFAVFRKQSDYDTVKVLFMIPVYFGYSKIKGINSQSESYLKNGSVLSGEIKRIYDLRGRLARDSRTGGTADRLKLTNGVYLLRGDGGVPIIIRPNTDP